MDAAEPPAPAARPRAAWVDVARSFAMFPIIWMHAGDAPAWSGRLVGGGLFLFFLLAGYFMPREPRPCCTRALRLATAWALWSVIAALLYFAVAPEHGIDWRKLLGWGVNAYDTPLWFLRNLAVYELLIAALLVLRLLPRHTWLLTAVLASLAYAGSPAQQLTIRFDWFWVTLLGFSLRCVPVPQIETWLARHAAVLLPACVVVLCQPWLWSQYRVDVGFCSLPTFSAAWCVLYFLAALALQRFLPRAAGALAFSGRGMMFCYVTHSFFLSPFYMGYDLNWGYNLWVPPLLLILLPLLGAGLQRLFPRAMRLLLAR